MSTWEERMSLRAAERARKEMERQQREDEDLHADHHIHLDGASVYCSCGEFHGITCVIIPDDPHWYENLHCSICGKPGVADLKG